MLEINALTAGYPGRPVLDGISFTAEPGQITAILGPNGCGKTTLLKALCGIVPIQRGQILLEGTSLTELPRNKRAQKIAYLPQSRQVPRINAGALVLHGRFPYLRYPRQYSASDIALARSAMESLDIAGLWDTPLEQLSGGQRQKVYIAMALTQDTPVILLDEPMVYLDIRHQLQLLTLTRELADRGKTVVTVLHDLPQALTRADKLLLLRSGRLLAQGTPEAVFQSGSLSTAFGVTVQRHPTPKGWHYYWEDA